MGNKLATGLAESSVEAHAIRVTLTNREGPIGELTMRLNRVLDQGIEQIVDELRERAESGGSDS